MESLRTKQRMINEMLCIIPRITLFFPSSAFSFSGVAQFIIWKLNLKRTYEKIKANNANRNQKPIPISKLFDLA
jgi:hypothetical protein